MDLGKKFRKNLLPIGSEKHYGIHFSEGFKLIDRQARLPSTPVQVVYCTRSKREDEISLIQTNKLKRLWTSHPHTRVCPGLA